MNYHKCLLCPCQIREDEVYCWSCGDHVSAVRDNANHGGKWAKEWDTLWVKIQKLQSERQNK